MTVATRGERLGMLLAYDGVEIKNSVVDDVNRWWICFGRMEEFDDWL